MAGSLLRALETVEKEIPSASAIDLMVTGPDDFIGIHFLLLIIAQVKAKVNFYKKSYENSVKYTKEKGGLWMK